MGEPASKCPISFADPATQTNPFPAYEELRQQSPIYLDPLTGHYNVLDFGLIRQIATDTKRFSNDAGLVQVHAGEIGQQIKAIQEEFGVPSARVLLITDPPEHSFYRSQVDTALSPVRVKKLEQYLYDTINRQIDTFIDEGEIDFVQRMAVMIPVFVIANLLGVDSSRLDDIKTWSDASSGATDPTISDEEKLRLTRISCELEQFILRQANSYREEPNDSLLSSLANVEIDGRRLTDSELVAMAQQIIVAGHETTSGAMSSAVMRIITTPGLEAELRQNSDRIPFFVEEVLRLDSPLQCLFRCARQDVEIGGCIIPKGAVIIMRWGAGNRDPKRFECPATLDMDRPNVGRHVAFGHGPHFCIGNQLARAELRIAFTELLKRMCNLRLSDRPDAIARTSHYFLYGITRMFLKFDHVDEAAGLIPRPLRSQNA